MSATRDRPDRADLLADLRERVFAPPTDAPPARVGMEVELLLLAEDGRVLPLEAPDGAGVRGTERVAPGPALLDLVRRVGEPLGWREGRTVHGSPAFQLPGGGVLNFEPGGQLELSSVAEPSLDRVLAGIGATLDPLVRVAREEGAVAVTRGIDPVNEAGDVPLQVAAPRYTRMAAHFERIGPAGRRMMRQTAALHVNVDLDPGRLLRWRVANAMAPVLAAVFANSPRYRGGETGYRSFRSEQWRRLDPSRTGLAHGSGDPLLHYLDFALGGAAFLLGPEDEPARPFEEWLERGVDRAAWETHLSTLFPEVRPRGYLEVRAIDALDPEWYAVPAVLVAGVLYDEEALREADRLLPSPTFEALQEAGRAGVRDAELRGRASGLFELALAGAERLGPGFAGEEALDTVRRYRDRFTARGRDPGGEPAPLDGPAAPEPPALRRPEPPGAVPAG